MVPDGSGLHDAGGVQTFAGTRLATRSPCAFWWLRTSPTARSSCRPLLSKCRRAPHPAEALRPMADRCTLPRSAAQRSAALCSAVRCCAARRGAAPRNADPMPAGRRRSGLTPRQAAACSTLVPERYQQAAAAEFTAAALWRPFWLPLHAAAVESCLLRSFAVHSGPFRSFPVPPGPSRSPSRSLPVHPDHYRSLPVHPGHFRSLPVPPGRPRFSTGASLSPCMPPALNRHTILKGASYCAPPAFATSCNGTATFYAMAF